MPSKIAVIARVELFGADLWRVHPTTIPRSDDAAKAQRKRIVELREVPARTKLTPSENASTHLWRTMASQRRKALCASDCTPRANPLTKEWKESTTVRMRGSNGSSGSKEWLCTCALTLLSSSPCKVISSSSAWSLDGGRFMSTFSSSNVRRKPIPQQMNAPFSGDRRSCSRWREENSCTASGSRCAMPHAKKTPAEKELARLRIRGSPRKYRGANPKPILMAAIVIIARSKKAKSRDSSRSWEE
mmetsp:Transcript_40399/g.127163  ORF Transcript_40399/g.127163 Transcript_40399/m.127163 type:complete len:245 (+) Transcript_40399:3579-4313(+)